jgi:membrane protease YdiL (CAAX protease family)
MYAVLPSIQSFNYNTITIKVRSAVDSITVKVSQIYAYVADPLTEGTIFHALDNERLENDRKENLNKSFLNKISIGVINGCKGFALNIVISEIFVCVIYLISNLETDNVTVDISLASFTEIALAIPIIEEMIFRLFLQNTIRLVQFTATCITPDVIQKTRVFIWLTSPSCRVILVSAAFAYVHLGNGGAYLSTAEAVAQVATFLFDPRESVLYETTNSFVTPVASHITNNAICWALLKIATLHKG